MKPACSKWWSAVSASEIRRSSIISQVTSQGFTNILVVAFGKVGNTAVNDADHLIERVVTQRFGAVRQFIERDILYTPALLVSGLSRLFINIFGNFYGQ